MPAMGFTTTPIRRPDVISSSLASESLNLLEDAIHAQSIVLAPTSGIPIECDQNLLGRFAASHLSDE